ncbi:MAG: HAD family hydrolase [Alphaproteobacteria bacterium]
MAEPLRIAMWSGPRNLSTALMRSFGARVDCAVVDEPFYAAYLAATGLDHPMRDAVIADGETDPDAVVARCLGPVPGGRPVFYQKHMCHHMIAGFPRDWVDRVANVFLIRDPAHVVASYAAKRENPSLADIGFGAQKDLFDRVADRLGAAPPVLDAGRVRADPHGCLTALCGRLGIAFDAAMLHWPPGPRPEDGVWAAHWYGAVLTSTGFAPPEAPPPALDGAAARLAAQARPLYDAMLAFAL